MRTVFVQFIYLYCNVTDLWAMYFGRANFNAKSGMISPARTTNVFWVKTLVGCTPVVAQLYCIETLQQTQVDDPVPVYWWTNVCDAGPTLNHHWFDVSRLLVQQQE